MKQILQKLRQIKKYCAEHDNHCHNCVYDTERFDCVWMSITNQMHNECPDEWDLERVEEILNESGR